MFETNRENNEVLSNDPHKNTHRTNPSMKLTRSSSSVTLRNNSSALSLHCDKDSSSSRSSRLRRRVGLGSEESLTTMMATFDHHDLAICPPPPLYDHHINSSTALSPTDSRYRNERSSKNKRDPSNSMQSLAAGSRLDTPSFGSVRLSPNSARRLKLAEKTSVSNVRVFPADERPELPIKIKKKSKSFRFTSRDQFPSSSTSTREFDLTRSCAPDLNNYFSLDRAKNDPTPLNGNAAIGKSLGPNRTDVNPLNTLNLQGDLSAINDGYKLSVYQSTVDNSLKSFEDASNFRIGADDERPKIPPKKSIQERNKMSVSSDNCQTSTSFTGSCSNNKFTEAVLGPRHHLISTYENSPTHSLAWKSSQSSDSEQSLYDQLPCSHNTEDHSPVTPSRRLESSFATTFQVNKNSNIAANSKRAKDYVNARLVCAADGTESLYVPLPTRRITTDSSSDKKTHDYANFSLDENEQLCLTDELCKLNSPRGDNYTTDVTDSCQSREKSKRGTNESISQTKSSASDFYLKSVHELHKVGNAFRSDYEPIDFGENSGDLSDLVEVVNRELVGDGFNSLLSFDRSSNASVQDVGQFSDSSANDVSLHNSLDHIARQVYQDCEDYLLHGSNKSPVPSLMPKADNNSIKSTKSSNLSPELLLASHRHERVAGDHSSEASSPNRAGTAKKIPHQEPMNVADVKNKVNVTPQGLRTRERRNSYRQAVNHINNWRADKTSNLSPHKNLDAVSRVAAKIGPNILESSEEYLSKNPLNISGNIPADYNAKKSINKYETIWFEKTRETSHSDENLRLTRSVIEPGFMTSCKSLSSRGPVGDWVRTRGGESSPQDVPVRTDTLPGFVNSLERGRATKDALPATNQDVCSTSINPNYYNNSNSSTLSSSCSTSNSLKVDKSNSSRSSNSTNSTANVGSSTTLSSDKEPIYVNTCELRAAVELQIRQPQSLPLRSEDKSTPSTEMSSLLSSSPLSTNSPVNRRPPPATFSANNKITAEQSPSSTGSRSSLSVHLSDYDTFPLIKKPAGPCPTTPTKQNSRTLTGSHITVPQAKSLGEVRQPCSTNENPRLPMSDKLKVGAQEYSCFQPAVNNSLLPEHNKHLHNDLNIIRPLPAPPSHQTQQHQKQNSNNIKRINNVNNNTNQQLNPTAKFAIESSLEPIYDVPYNASRQVRSNYQGHRVLTNPATVGVKAPYSLPLCTGQQQVQFLSGHVSRVKAHIVGDIAIVGESTKINSLTLKY